MSDPADLPALDECTGCRALRKRVAKLEERFPDDIDARELEKQLDDHETRLVEVESALTDLRELNAGVRQLLARNHIQEMTLEKANSVIVRATLVLDAINEREAKAAREPG